MHTTPPGTPHRIRRLRWQVRTPRADAALAVRVSLRDWLPDVEAALEAAFNQQGGGDDVRHLASLSLNLKLPEAFSQQDLMRELGTALGQALHDAASEMAPPDLPPVTPAQAGQGPAATTGTGHMAPLLCALQAARVQAPDALREALHAALTAAGEQRRNDGLCELNWLGQRWAVRGGDVAHWLACLTDARAEQALHDGAAQGAERHGRGPASNTSAKAAANTAANASLRPGAGERAIGSRKAGPGDAGQALAQTGPGTPPTDSSKAEASRRAADALSLRSPSGSQQLQAQLLHYLRTGQLDWVLAGLPASEAKAALREAASLWVSWGLVPGALPATSALAQRLGALSRWLALLTDEQRRAVHRHHIQTHTTTRPGVEHAAPEHALAKLWPDLLQVLADGGPVVRADSLHAQALWLDWLAAGGVAMGALPLQHWLNEALPWVEALRQQGPSSDVWHALLALGAATPAPLHTAHAPGQDDAAHVSLVIHTDAQRRGLASAQEASPSEGPVRPLPAAIPAPMLPAREPSTSNGLIVSQAGLVLLHAYLPRCLDVLGLYPSGQRGPLADHLWPRAAAVLHWLATGQDGALECELGLIKPLLGRRDQHDEHDALSHGLPTLLPHEREEADALLRAVLGHWRALKGTSVAGLRESFLQRRGWLETRGGASLLRVEPAPYDVLLGSLPWGMSLVRLPWMAQPLHVEWSAP